MPVPHYNFNKKKKGYVEVNIVLTGNTVAQDTKNLAFEQNNLVDVITVTVDTDSTWGYQIYVEYPKDKCSGQQLYNIINLNRSGNICTATLTTTMLPFNGKYIMQLVATDTNGKRKHSDRFEAWVKASINVDKSYDPMPSAFTQTLDAITELNNHPPKPGSNGYWLIWNLTTKQYEESTIPTGVTLPDIDETTAGKYLTNNGSLTYWNNIDVGVTSVNGQTGTVVLDAEDVGADVAGSAQTVQGNLTTHTNNVSNPHQVTKSQIGLGNVNNTSDADKPISTATQTALDGKQPTITDLENIRAGATLGSTAYQKPVNGIPSTDMTNAVRSSLALADSALQEAPVTDITINSTSVLDGTVAKIVYETGLGADSSNAATVTAIRAFVNSSIEAVAAYYITSNMQGDAFATKAALNSGPYYYAGTLRTPTRNDYAIVVADETHSNQTARYTYVKADGASSGQWAFQYTFNMSFTQTQINAINSGINTTKVALYDTHLANTSNPHSVTKAQIGLGNVDNVQQYSASNPPPYPVTSVNSKTGIVNLTYSDVGADASGAANTVQGNLTTHTNNTNNPHSVTKVQVGLGDVGNFKAVSTVANQGLTDTEKSNARGNIGAGTYTVPSGGIPENDLASSVQNKLNKTEVFIAEYNVTPFADVMAAIQAGKIVKCRETKLGILIGTYYAEAELYWYNNNNAKFYCPSSEYMESVESTAPPTIYAVNSTGWSKDIKEDIAPIQFNLEDGVLTCQNTFEEVYDILYRYPTDTYAELATSNESESEILFGYYIATGLRYIEQGEEDIIAEISFAHQTATTTDILTINSNEICTRTIITPYVKPVTGIPSSDMESAVQASLAKADSALQSVPNTYRTSAAQDAIDATKLTEPSTGLAVGKYFRIASIDASGHAVLEAVDAPSSAMKLKLAGTAQTPDADGYVNVPKASSHIVSGLVNGTLDWRRQGVSIQGWERGAFGPTLYKTDEHQIDIRNQITDDGRTPIITSILDYSVKAAMTDGIGTAWTDAEKQGAWARLNSIKTSMDAVAVAGAKYFLGQQSSVSITMPTANILVGQTIEIFFSSGATACTLSCDLTGFSFVPKANKSNKIVFTLIHKADAQVVGDEDEWVYEVEES